MTDDNLENSNGLKNNSFVDKTSKNSFKYESNHYDEDSWASFEQYLERKGVSGAIAEALYQLFNENDWPDNAHQYIYEKLRTCSNTREVNKRMQRKLAKMNDKMKSLTNEIDHLSLIRENRLNYSLYKNSSRDRCVGNPKAGRHPRKGDKAKS